MSSPDGDFGAPDADGSLAPPGPLPNRFSRATLLGCLGIACVMALPLLLFLPLDTWRVPGWLALLAPLAGIVGLAVGAGLLMRVPSGSMPARNPFAPLTAAGAPPLVERPATAANRAGAAAALALFTVALLAVVIIAGGSFQQRELLPALFTLGLCGAALVAYGALIGTRRLPPPALHWVRQPVRGQIRPAVTLVLAGLAAITWMLLVAADAGYRWGYIGLGLLVVGGVMAAPLARRAPRSER